MIIGTVRPEEAIIFDSDEGYHSFHDETGEKYGSFFVSWHDGVPAYASDCACDDCSECDENSRPPGWYWIAQFPGCMPDGDFQSGPFASSSQAMYDADEFHPDNED